jgi:hypothetical protein
VPFRRGKAGDVDVVAGHDILEDRTIVDIFGRDARHRSHEAGAEAFAELELGEVGGKAERHVLALAAEEVDQHSAAIDRVRHLVEDEAGCAVVVHRDAGHHADVLLPVEPADILDLAQPARLVEPLPQIVIGQPRRRIGRGATIGGRAARIAGDAIVLGVGLRGHETSRSGTCRTMPRARLRSRGRAYTPGRRRASRKLPVRRPVIAVRKRVG